MDRKLFAAFILVTFSLFSFYPAFGRDLTVGYQGPIHSFSENDNITKKDYKVIPNEIEFDPAQKNNNEIYNLDPQYCWGGHHYLSSKSCGDLQSYENSGENMTCEFTETDCYICELLPEIGEAATCADGFDDPRWKAFGFNCHSDCMAQCKDDLINETRGAVGINIQAFKRTILLATGASYMFGNVKNPVVENYKSCRNECLSTYELADPCPEGFIFKADNESHYTCWFDELKDAVSGKDDSNRIGPVCNMPGTKAFAKTDPTTGEARCGTWEAVCTDLKSGEKTYPEIN